MPPGSWVSLGLQGLESSEELTCQIMTAVGQSDIMEASSAEVRHSKRVVEDWTPHHNFQMSEGDWTVLWRGILLPVGEKAAWNEDRLKKEFCECWQVSNYTLKLH